MNELSVIRGLQALAITLMTALAVAAPAIAHAGGHGGGSRGGGFGFHGGGRSGFGGFHGGYYGYRGGYGGRYGRLYGGYGYGGWGWPGYGLYLSTLPYGYSTYWWDAVPYYYADSNYYVWDGPVGGYEAVNPPTEVVNQARMQRTETELFAYPKNGQSAEQQARSGTIRHKHCQHLRRQIRTGPRRQRTGRGTCAPRRHVCRDAVIV